MKSKVIHLDPELQQAAEAVLREDESLSEFVGVSLRKNITHRQLQNEFLARGLAARDDARRAGKYFDAAEVLAELEETLRAKRSDRSSS